jgi:hypothetical protein
MKIDEVVNMRSKKKRSKLLEVGKMMPPSYNTLPGHEFTYEDSEVLQWIANQPELLAFIRDCLKNADYITYDSKTGLWRGVDYKTLTYEPGVF